MSTFINPTLVRQLINKIYLRRRAYLNSRTSCDYSIYIEIIIVIFVGLY